MPRSPTHAPQCEQLAGAVKAAEAAQVNTALRLTEAEEAGLKLEAELGAARAKLAQADSSLKVRGGGVRCSEVGA